MVYLKRQLISSLEEIKKFRDINMELEEENRIVSMKILSMCTRNASLKSLVKSNPNNRMCPLIML